MHIFGSFLIGLIVFDLKIFRETKYIMYKTDLLVMNNKYYM